MKTFSDRWRQLEWDDIRLRINSKTAADVEQALAAKQLTRDDMMACFRQRRPGILNLWPSARGAPASASAIPSASTCRCISPTCAPTTAPTAASR